MDLSLGLLPDDGFFRPVIPGAIVAALGYFFPALRSGLPAVCLCMAAVALVFQRQAPGQLLWIALPYLAAVAIRSALPVQAKPGAKRWTLACWTMGFWCVLFCVSGFYMEPALRWGSGPWEMQWASMPMSTLLAAITFFWEFGSGRVALPGIGRFLYWIALPFTLLGPLLRLSELDARDRKPPPPIEWPLWAKTLGLGLLQLGLGSWLAHAVPPLSSPTLQKGFATLFSGPWSFYLQASGGAHCMEAFAALWGITMIPNYRAPFGQPNLSEFWTRWNITATNVFREYIFFNRWGAKQLNPYLNSMILFTAVGVWHGRNVYWISWGVLHGIGFCAFLYFRQLRKERPHLFFTLPGQSGVWLSRVATYVFVCACWYLPNKIALLFQ